MEAGVSFQADADIHQTEVGVCFQVDAYVHLMGVVVRFKSDGRIRYCVLVHALRCFAVIRWSDEACVFVRNAPFWLLFRVTPAKNRLGATPHQCHWCSASVPQWVRCTQVSARSRRRTERRPIVGMLNYLY